MMQTKISIITVCYNAIEGIEKTILSVLGQSYSNIEYIVIDGGSTDGTIDVIQKYRGNIAYFVSEQDDGIYDAMNKGVRVATGEWINFLNAGDFFASDDAIKVLLSVDTEGIDVIYGDSIEVDRGFFRLMPSSAEVKRMEYEQVYRHGSSLVRASVHKQHLFDLKRKDLGYALDWELIHRLYIDGFEFKRVDMAIECYELQGTSFHPMLNRWYNFKVTISNGITLKKVILLMYSSMIDPIKRLFQGHIH